MKQLQELINKSWYGSVGYVKEIKNLYSLEHYIQTNLEVLKEFEGVVVATNYYDFDLAEQNRELWEIYLPDVMLIDNPVNRGHSFGTADLDNLLVRWCKENDIQWLCKASNDVLITPETLELMIPEADFYYTDGFSYEDLSSNHFDYSLMYGEHFFPQTNFYLIDVSKIDYLANEDYLNETYAYSQTIPNFNGKIWEHLPEWACENFLKGCVKRNDLVKHNMLDLKTYTKLCNVIEKHKVGDPSHKNIMINGVCHFQFPTQKIIKI